MNKTDVSRITLSEFLKNHIIKKDEVTAEKPITHTRIGDVKSNIYGGSYHVPDTEYDTLMRLVYQQVVQKRLPEYLTEKQLDDGGPIVIDLDFRYDYLIEEKQHTKDHIEDLLYAYLAELEKIFQFDGDTKFPIFVLEK